MWLTEHHGLTEYSHMAANEVHAGYLAASTDRIHIGAGIFNISPRVNHPVRTAEKVATLDHLTNRRFEFGTGRGAGSHEIATLNIHDKESTRADYDDVIYEIVRMWEQKDYTYHGTHWDMDVPHNVLPKPWGPGHPPFWLAVGSPATWEKAGRLGQGALGFTFSVGPRRGPVDRGLQEGDLRVHRSGRRVRQRQRDDHHGRALLGRPGHGPRAGHPGGQRLPPLDGLAVPRHHAGPRWLALAQGRPGPRGRTSSTP